MVIITKCNKCWAQFNLKDDLLNKKVKCTNCSNIFLVENIQSNSQSKNENVIKEEGDIDSWIFWGHIYWVKQKKLAINEKYFIKDSQNNDILFAVRKIYLLRWCLSIILVIIWIGLCFIGYGSLSSLFVDISNIFILFFVIVIMLVGIFIIFYLIKPKRHIKFYKSLEDEKLWKIVFEVEQDKKIPMIIDSFTFKDNKSSMTAKFKKNIFTNILRRKWHIYMGERHFLIKEDSIILWLLRRLLPFGGLIRTNFIFLDITNDPKSNVILWFYKRKFELFDNYKLDMSSDVTYKIPRQIAICLAVLLDTGERR